MGVLIRVNQIKRQLLYKAVKEPDFGRDILSKIPTAEFKDSKVHKDLFIIINDYYKKNSSPLDENTLETITEERLGKLSISLEEQSVYKDAISDLYQIDEQMQNDDVIENSLQKYIRSVLSKKAIEKVLLTGSLDDEGTINKLIESLREVSLVNTLGADRQFIDFFHDTDKKRELLRDIDVEKSPTGFVVLDQIAEGGLGEGEMALVNAKSGGGKTMTLVSLARNFVLQGKSVAYFSLEERLGRMLLRFEQTLSQQTKRDLAPNGALNVNLYNHIQDAYKVAQDTNGWGELYIHKYYPDDLSPTRLEQDISDLIVRNGKKTDVVIIDYPDLMYNPYLNKSENESKAGGRLFAKLRKIAQKYAYQCWTASQLNRTGYDNQTLTVYNIEGSKQKVNACELVITLNQSEEEFKGGFIRFYVDKLRNNSGAAYDRMLPLRVMPSTMTIRDESPEEAEEHRILMENTDLGGKSDFRKKSEVTQEEVANRITEINTAIPNAR